jgi:deazaflavin-dependent oxidoreductase (nitroreductase family)
MATSQGKKKTEVATVAIRNTLGDKAAEEHAKEFNADFIERYRASEGEIAGGAGNDASVLILHAIGAKSGQVRLSPVYYFDRDGRWYVAGSFGGSRKDPAWVINVRANPDILVERGKHTHQVTVRELPAEERDALWPYLVREYPNFEDFQSYTERTIPVFELVPR